MTADKMHPRTLGPAARSLGLAVVLVAMAGLLAASDGGASAADSGSMVKTVSPAPRSGSDRKRVGAGTRLDPIDHSRRSTP